MRKQELGHMLFDGTAASGGAKSHATRHNMGQCNNRSMVACRSAEHQPAAEPRAKATKWRQNGTKSK